MLDKTPVDFLPKIATMPGKMSTTLSPPKRLDGAFRSNTPENSKERRAESMDILGRFSKAIFGEGYRNGLVYFAGISRFLYGDGDEFKDIDMCATKADTRAVYHELNSEKLKREFGVEGLEIVTGETPPILGEYDTLHLKCTVKFESKFEKEKKVIPVDLYSNFDDSNKQFLGLPMNISLDNEGDVKTREIEYHDKGQREKMVVPTLSLGAMGPIYDILREREPYYAELLRGIPKNRIPSMAKIFRMNAVDAELITRQPRVAKAYNRLSLALAV